MSDAFVLGDGDRVLATDLDGTLIPLDGDARQREDLEVLAARLAGRQVTLLFVTGRHLESVAEAMRQFHLPAPHWLIADVGTSLYRYQAGGDFAPVEAYWQYQDGIIAALPLEALRARLAPLDGLSLQEPAKQGRFKLSFYADAARLEDRVAAIDRVLETCEAPYSVIHSIDPFNGDGLIDVLPAGVSKARALAWWVERTGLDPEAVVFAGDSGNDLAALTAGYRAIVVGNARRPLARRVYDAHRRAGWHNRLYLSRGAATSGVREGCRWFGLIDDEVAPPAAAGATPVSCERTHFRVWAPRKRHVAVEVQHASGPARHDLTRDESGHFYGTVPAEPGARYRYLLDGGAGRPDPVSRFQPGGVHGPSQVIDPGRFAWTDQNWPGIAKRDLVLYELHVGAWTDAGTFRAAIEHLDELVALGVTAVEIMPVSQSPGKWNWGYDGVHLFAVRNTYGTPDDFKAFVDACHAAGLAVILDVVYNHLGPEGNYLADYGPYFSRRHRTPWGDAFNFDGRSSGPVRRLVIDNALYWLDEFHLDGLRLDAVHFMKDEGRPTILDELRGAVSRYAASIDRTLHLIAEANVFDARLIGQTAGGRAYDAIWCDCLMHAIYGHGVPDVRLTPRTYQGRADLAEALRHGYLYEHEARGPVRVTPERRRALLGPEPSRSYLHSLVVALQTHDAVGNHPRGQRLHMLTSTAFQRAAAALVLMYPGIPLIFMGEECASDAPFPFFADFEDPRLREAVDRGRAREHPQHAWRGSIPPSRPEAFLRARYRAAASQDPRMRAWYASLLKLRRRGVAAGWLAAEGMSAEHDAEHAVFTIRYDGPGGRRIVVQSRLAADEGSNDAVPAPLAGPLLLSSRDDPLVRDGCVLLHSGHAVVSGRLD